MNFCKFVPMMAHIISRIALFPRETGKIFQKILLGTSLVRFLKSNFIRTLAFVLIAVIGWTGISVSGSVSGNVNPGANGVNQLVMGDVAWAETPEEKAAREKNEGTGTVKAINAAINLMYALLTPLLALAGWLLTPDWAFGEIFGMRVVLHDLWILISNIVYVIFAFLLVAMAFMNIFGAE